VNKDSLLIASFFASSWAWSNCWWQRLIYYNQYLDTLDNDKGCLLVHYWTVLYTIFTVTCLISSYIEISTFCNDMNQSGRTDKNYDRLWKVWYLFDILSDTYVKFYNPFEHLAVDVIIVLF
jgi:hypothetical protein